MVYLIANIVLIPERFEEFCDVLEKEYLPLVEKHGGKLVGAWRTTIGNVDEVTDVWAYESLAQFEKVRQSQARDPVYLASRRKIRLLMTAENLKFASPLSCSPLQ